MSQAQRGSRVPQVNLFAPPARGLTIPVPARYLELGLICLVVVIWAAVGVGLALLLGWHPQIGLWP